MPGPLLKASDPALTASKLPRPLQWPVGAALGGLKSVLGDVPNPAMTTIGPGAIPLGNEDSYLRTALSKVTPDIIKTARKYLGSAPERIPKQVNTVLNPIMDDPDVAENIVESMLLPPHQVEQQAEQLWQHHASPDMVKNAIKALSNAFLGLDIGHK